ncbi:MAG TPA: MBL fold metallo-hydrolase [Thermoanaerobaculia bacterium]
MAIKAKAKAKPAAEAKVIHESAGIRVRMYRVGFGDFFLLTIPADDGPQHILIDCGVTPGTTHAGDIGTIKDAVAHMAEETENHLALIIVTHRHMDHIIGFSRCVDHFREFTVDAIWMPYWESEYDAQATKFQADLTAMALDVQQHLALAAGESIEIDAMLGMLRNATGVDDDELTLAAAGGDEKKKGKGGGTNAQSLSLLKTGLNVTPEYYAKGDKPKLPKALKAAGLKAEILGPPPADELDFMKLTDLRKGVGQYLGASDSVDGGKKFEPFEHAWNVDHGAYPKSAFREFQQRLKKGPPVVAHAALEKVVQAAQPQSLLTAVKEIDNFLNNQSLVVLFTFKDKKLLFVGDAQAGNWEYWMCGGTPTKTPTADDLSPEGKKILGSLDFYKVGHHGSTNATPITAVDAMGGNFVSMCSTQADTYGTLAKGTEVPRVPLLEALAAKSPTVRSDEFPVTIKDNEVDAIKDAPTKPPKTKQGKLVVGDIYVDYLL